MYFYYFWPKSFDKVIVALRSQPTPAPLTLFIEF